MRQPEISEAITTYLQIYQYATPKQLIDGIYPIFKRKYPKDSFRRLLYRNLKRLGIAKHPFLPFYYSNKGFFLKGYLRNCLEKGWNPICKRDHIFHSAIVGEEDSTFAEMFLKGLLK